MATTKARWAAIGMLSGLMAASGLVARAGAASPAPEALPRYLLVDVMEDMALGGWHRFTLVYTSDDPTARVLVSPKGRVARLSRAQLLAVVAELKRTNALERRGSYGGYCDDCPTWRIVVAADLLSNDYSIGGSGAERPRLAEMLAEFVR